MASVESSNVPASSQGGQGGGLFEDRGHTRGDAILIRKWAGVVDPEKVKPLIEKGYALAENAESERDYAAVMKVIQGFAKLEQEESKAVQPTTGTTTNIQINGDVRISNPDERRTELLGIIAAASDRARAIENSGTTDAPADPKRAIPPATDD